MQANPGFSQFAEVRAEERRKARAEDLAKSVDELRGKASFLRNWIAENLTADRTVELLPLLKRIDVALVAPEPNSIGDFGAEVDRALAKQGLQQEYQALRRTDPLGAGETQSTGGLDGSIARTERNRFLLDGNLDDLVLMFNVSPAAPNVYKNLNGDVGFDAGRAELCLAQATQLDPFNMRVLRGTLRALGAIKTELTGGTCAERDLDDFDLAVALRGDFLRSPPSLVIEILRRLDSGQLLHLETVQAAELKRMAQGEQVAALQIETDLDSNVRSGFG